MALLLEETQQPDNREAVTAATLRTTLLIALFLLASPQRCALGFYEDGAPPQHLNGFICLQWAADEAEILTLAVTPSRRRQGLASQLIASAAEWLAARGVKQWHVEVAADNQPARALYRRLAFVEIGERKGYYAGVDAALMRRDL